MLYCCSCQCPTSPDYSVIVVRANHKTPRSIHRCRKCHNRVMHNRVISAMKMQETIVHSTAKTSSVKFTGTGTFMDETDLNAKYAGQPQQLEAIKQNTRRLMCPIRRVLLFEDVSFTSTTEDQETRTEESKRQVE